MADEIVWQTDLVTVWYHPDSKIVHHQFHGFIQDKGFRDALVAGLAALKRHGAMKWLSDDRKNAALGPDDEDWANKVWQPQVIAAGWKYWAIVTPQRLGGKWNMERHAATYAALGVTVRMFSEPDEAMRWLESQQG